MFNQCTVSGYARVKKNFLCLENKVIQTFQIKVSGDCLEREKYEQGVGRFYGSMKRIVRAHNNISWFNYFVT